MNKHLSKKRPPLRSLLTQHLICIFAASLSPVVFAAGGLPDNIVIKGGQIVDIPSLRYSVWAARADEVASIDVQGDAQVQEFQFASWENAVVRMNIADGTFWLNNTGTITDQGLVATDNSHFQIYGNGVLKISENPSFKNNYNQSGTAIYVAGGENSTPTLQVNTKEIVIHNFKDGIRVDEQGTFTVDNRDQGGSLLIDTDSLTDNSYSESKRALLVYHGGKIDINTGHFKINQVGYSKDLYQGNEPQSAMLETITSSNQSSTIAIRAENIDLQSFSPNGATDGTTAVWGYAEGKNGVSTISLQADKTLNVKTSWSGIYAQAQAGAQSNVDIEAQDVVLQAEGSSVLFSDADGVDNSQARINVSAQNVHIGWYTDQVDKYAQPESHFSLLSTGTNATTIVNAASLRIDAENNFAAAAAFNGGSVQINPLNNGQQTLIHGNLYAENIGTVSASLLGTGSLLKGAATDYSAVALDPEQDNPNPDQKTAGSITVTGGSGATWLVQKTWDGHWSNLQYLKAEKTLADHSFTVDLTQEADPQRLLVGTLAGQGADFHLRFQTQPEGAVIDAHESGDQVIVDKGLGDHSIFVQYSGDGAQKLAMDNYLVRDVNGTAKFTLSNKGQHVAMGTYYYVLDHRDTDLATAVDGTATDWFLKRTDKVTPGGDTPISFSGSARYLHWMDEEDLRKRLGEVRYGAQQGAWVRYSIQKDGAGGAGPAGGMDQNYRSIKVGYDHIATQDEEVMWLLGGNLVYGNADQKTRDSGFGTGKTDKYGANLYATWLNAAGYFADFVLTADYLKQQMSTYEETHTGTGKFDTWGLGASVELGKMFSSEQNDLQWGPWYQHYWIEPQMQLSYYWVNGKSFPIQDSGVRVSYADTDSLVGRLGIVAGKKWNYGLSHASLDRRYVQAWIKAGVRHDFLSGHTMTLNDLSVTDEVGKTTFYYGVGGDWELGWRTKAYWNIEREQGDGYKKDYYIALGLKHAF